MSRAKRGENAPPRRSRARLGDNYRFMPQQLEQFYDAEHDYHFAEAKEQPGVGVEDFQFFEASDVDTIDDMSSALNESQRRAVRWRITALRCIGVLNAITLMGGCLPTWIMMLRWNRESLLAERAVQRCDEAYRAAGGDFRDQTCVYYRHELSTYTAFVGGWMFGTLMQSLFMIFTSWRLHNKSFQAVVSIWTFVFMVVGLAASLYTTTNLTLMAEDFNWRLAAPEVRYATYQGDVKDILVTSLRAFLGLLYALLLTQGLWMWLMHQVLQFGLNLQEFGTEICGDRIASAAEENAIAMQSVVDKMFDDPKHRSSSHFSRHRNGSVEDDFQELNSDDEDDFDDDIDNPAHIASDEPNLDSQAPQGASINSVMELMSTLTSTMSALNQKIDAIESRVGDGTALLVMPPGENQWDARKPGQS